MDRNEEIEERISFLYKKATTCKKINWNQGVAYLQEMNALMKTSRVIYSAEYWTRLPVFLQSAGRFDEAMEEFERLLQEVEPRINKEMGHCTPTAIRYFCHVNVERIYDKMRMVCKRQKLTEETNKYAKLSEQEMRTVLRLKKVVEKQEEKRLEKFRNRKE